MIALLERLKQEYAESVEEVERYAPAVISVAPETMAAFLDSLEDEHGTFDDLARSLGVTDAVARLRASLLEPRSRLPAVVAAGERVQSASRLNTRRSDPSRSVTALTSSHPFSERARNTSSTLPSSRSSSGLDAPGNSVSPYRHGPTARTLYNSERPGPGRTTARRRPVRHQHGGRGRPHSVRTADEHQVNVG